MKKLILFMILVMVTLAISACTMSQRAPGEEQTIQADRFVPPSEAEVMPANQGQATIKIDPATVTLNAGETVKVNIVIENVTNLFAADVKIQFNPSVLQVQDADPGKDGIQIEAGTFPSPDFTPTNAFDNPAGTGQYAVTQLAPNEPVSGNGILASLTFEAVADGASPITIAQGSVLASGEGTEISAQLVSGNIQVGQGGDPPTNTPTSEPQATDTPAPQATDTPTNVPQATNTPVPGATNTPVSTQPTNTPTTQPTIIVPTTVPATIVPTTGPPPTAVPTYVPPSTYLPPGATVGFCYRVQSGDTLYSLGERFGLDYETINIANMLWPPNHIYANQALFVPTQMGQGPNFYIAQHGDTLATISHQCHLPIAFMERMNRDVLAPYNGQVVPGMAIRIQIPPFRPPSMGSHAPIISPNWPTEPCQPQQPPCYPNRCGTCY